MTKKRPTIERDGADVLIRIPMKFRRRGGRREIVVPEGSRQQDQASPHGPLVVALARAHRWQELLEAGTYPSIAALAMAVGVDRTYVARILNLTLLAPGLVDAVLDGREPSGLPLERLTNRLPEAWIDQPDATISTE